MTNPILIVSVNGGAPQSGHVTVSSGDTIQPSVASSVGITAYRYAFSTSPDGWATPAGWALDGSSGEVYWEGPTPNPPAVVMPAVGGVWGGWPLYVQANGNPSLRDNSMLIEIVSPRGLHDMPFAEDAQVDALKHWTKNHQKNLRAIETALGTAGNGQIAVTLPNSATYTESAANAANRSLAYTGGNQDCTVTLPTPANPAGYYERTIFNATAFNVTVKCGGGGTVTLPPLNPDFSIPTAVIGFTSGGNAFLVATPSAWATQPAADVALTLVANSHHLFVPVSALSANRIIAYPAAPFAGQHAIVKDKDGSLAAHNITVSGNGKNIDGAATVTLSAPSWAPKSAIHAVYDGFAWCIV